MDLIDWGDSVPCTGMTLHCCLPINDIQGSLGSAFCSSSVVVNWLMMVVKRDRWLNSEELSLSEALLVVFIVCFCQSVVVYGWLCFLVG